MMDRLFRRDATLKVISVGLALLLWFQASAVSTPALPQQVREVTVELRNLGQGLVLLSGQPSVNLLIRGRTEDLLHVTRDNFTAYVDLLGAGLGSATYPVKIEAPESITVSQVTPAEVRVDIDALDNRQVPVSVWTIGSPAADHAMKSAVTKPTDLYVEGPRSQIQLVVRVVAQVDLTGATGGISRTVVVRPVNADGAEVQGVTVTPSAVDVTIAVVQLPPASEVTVRANLQGRPAAGFVQDSLTISPATVKLYATGQIADATRYLWTHPIDIEGLSATVTREVLLLLPDGAEKIEPAVVSVTVGISEAQEDREFRDLPVASTGVAQGLGARVEPGLVTVVVRGPRSQVAALVADDLTASVDATGLAAGTYQLRVSVSLPEGLTTKSISPVEVRVVLEKP